MKKKSVIKILRYILFPILSVIIGLTLYQWNAEKLVGTKVPMPFGYGAAVILSGSMEPEYYVDDLIFIKETNDYIKNDIVVFQDGSTVVVHRIIEINEDNIITKGDANNTADDPIAEENILGEVIFHIPRAGIIVNIIKNPVGFIIILAAAVFLLEYSYKKEKEGSDNELEKIKEEIRRLKAEAEKETKQ